MFAQGEPQQVSPCTSPVPLLHIKERKLKITTETLNANPEPKNPPKMERNRVQ